MRALQSGVKLHSVGNCDINPSQAMQPDFIRMYRSKAIGSGTGWHRWFLRFSGFPVLAIIVLFVVSAAFLTTGIDGSVVSNFATSFSVNDGYSALVVDSQPELRGTIDSSSPGDALERLVQPDDFLTKFHVHRILLILHVVGLIAGLGGTLFVDLYMWRFLYQQPITAGAFELVRFGGKIVTTGLTILWLSGIGFLYLYWNLTPESLANPKIWAKVVIVCLLTLNGIAIHHHCMSRVKGRIGEHLFLGNPFSKVIPTIAVAAISVSGWFSAFLLGMVKELNFVVPGSVLLASYAAIAGIFFATMLAIHWLFSARN